MSDVQRPSAPANDAPARYVAGQPAGAPLSEFGAHRLSADANLGANRDRDHPSPGAVCILGLGLIGGSLLRRLDAVAPGSAFGWNRSAPTVDAARADSHDATTDLASVLKRARDADALIVVAVPMPAVAGILERVAQVFPDAAVTDVVSVKGPVLDAARKAGLGARYVGGHPMAGTNQTGWSATDPALFEGATWVVGTEVIGTGDCGADGAGGSGSAGGSGAAGGPGAEAVLGTAPGAAGPDPDVWARVAGLARLAGSRVVALDAASHDRAVARISHLPHVLAEALAVSGAQGGSAALTLGAGSFRDGTRVAATPAPLVRAICEPNSDALAEVLAETIDELRGALDALRASGTLGDLVDRGHAGRVEFEAAHADILSDQPSPGSGAAPGQAASAGAAIGAGTGAVAVEIGADSGPVTVEIGAAGWAQLALDAGRAGRTIEPLLPGPPHSPRPRPPGPPRPPLPPGPRPPRPSLPRNT